MKKYACSNANRDKREFFRSVHHRCQNDFLKKKCQWVYYYNKIIRKFRILEYSQLYHEIHTIRRTLIAQRLILDALFNIFQYKFIYSILAWEQSKDGLVFCNSQNPCAKLFDPFNSLQRITSTHHIFTIVTIFFLSKEHAAHVA